MTQAQQGRMRDLVNRWQQVFVIWRKFRVLKREKYSSGKSSNLDGDLNIKQFLLNFQLNPLFTSNFWARLIFVLSNFPFSQ